MFHELQRAAQTNPKLKAVDWAVPLPADPQDWEINPEALLRVRTNIAAIAANTDAEPDDDNNVPAEQDGIDRWAEPDLEETSDDTPSWTETPLDVGAR